MIERREVLGYVLQLTAVIPQFDSNGYDSSLQGHRKEGTAADVRVHGRGLCDLFVSSDAGATRRLWLTVDWRPLAPARNDTRTMR